MLHFSNLCCKHLWLEDFWAASRLATRWLSLALGVHTLYKKNKHMLLYNVVITIAPSLLDTILVILQRNPQHDHHSSSYSSTNGPWWIFLPWKLRCTEQGSTLSSLWSYVFLSESSWNQVLSSLQTLPLHTFPIALEAFFVLIYTFNKGTCT